jgi:TfoX C-terminal domain.
MSDWSNVPNVGKELIRLLAEAEVTSYEELKQLGSEQVFLRLKAIDSGACFCKLCALEGAIQDIRWHHLSDERKQELKHFFNMIKK